MYQESHPGRPTANGGKSTNVGFFEKQNNRLPISLVFGCFGCIVFDFGIGALYGKVEFGGNGYIDSAHNTQKGIYANVLECQGIGESA